MLRTPNTRTLVERTNNSSFYNIINEVFFQLKVGRTKAGW